MQGRQPHHGKREAIEGRCRSGLTGETIERRQGNAGQQERYETGPKQEARNPNFRQFDVKPAEPRQGKKVCKVTRDAGIGVAHQGDHDDDQHRHQIDVTIALEARIIIDDQFAENGPGQETAKHRKRGRAKGHRGNAGRSKPGEQRIGCISRQVIHLPDQRDRTTEGHGRQHQQRCTHCLEPTAKAGGGRQIKGPDQRNDPGDAQ